MGTTREEVLNIALDALGEPRSVGEDDDSSWVVRLRNAYEPRVRKALEAYPCNFASELTQLAATEPTPDDWDFGFNKPAGWMRTIQVSDCPEWGSRGIIYDDRQGRIMTNYSTTWLWWIDARWVQLEGSWPQHFADAISLDIAKAVMAATSESESKKERIAVEHKLAWRAFKTWDAQQKPSRPQDPGRYVGVRNGGLGFRSRTYWRG